MRYLTFKEIAAISQYIIERFSPGEQIGIKSVELLDSAVHRPQQSAFGTDAYATVFEKAGALFESVAQNHAFHNANKRTAFLSLTQFLSYNGYDFQMDSQKEQADFTVDVVNKKYTFDELVRIIEKYSTRMDK
ncbi:type II toxin-antitoxin system death-on-curing family toxin [Virgibacillus dakarensis]|uniref:Death-on-curing family protein n=1 Tax=Lentibacillus populi TaxID=1827502 RepID=A0A9W5X7J4_9BACI|nr:MULTISPECIES: type II toxin-antitoxin system death-on-curing family toxin [Bacillaceae]MBT2215652.1 type II toxin-antitoxin system death-on-curing family toxin [Virgibacillus dakarensis]MTW87654.1 type II toxin-antitoxin system death-on-curing family toxin [Virgibacillus dakarensis]GGB62220.1 death-on-curing family protein [Lentibacillus populi]